MNDKLQAKLHDNQMEGALFWLKTKASSSGPVISLDQLHLITSRSHLQLGLKCFINKKWLKFQRCGNFQGQSSSSVFLLFVLSFQAWAEPRRTDGRRLAEFSFVFPSLFRPPAGRPEQPKIKDDIEQQQRRHVIIIKDTNSSYSTSTETIRLNILMTQR